ncbi:MAG: hypothetical protein IJ764_03940 [Bacteroidales bacterium]|nr:hypothetical protein [Bacteroidales bacterium]
MGPTADAKMRENRSRKGWLLAAKQLLTPDHKNIDAPARCTIDKDWATNYAFERSSICPPKGSKSQSEFNQRASSGT